MKYFVVYTHCAGDHANEWMELREFDGPAEAVEFVGTENAMLLSKPQKFRVIRGDELTLSITDKGIVGLYLADDHLVS